MPPARAYWRSARRAEKEASSARRWRSAVGEGLESADLAEALDHRAVDLRVGEALDLEGDVGGGDGTRPPSGAGEREAIVVLVEEVGAQAEAVYDLAAGAALLARQRLGEPGDERVGALQVVVLEQRVEDRSGHDVVRGRVGGGRIEGARRADEVLVEHLAARVGVRVRVVRAAAQGGEPQQGAGGAQRAGGAAGRPEDVRRPLHGPTIAPTMIVPLPGLMSVAGKITAIGERRPASGERAERVEFRKFARRR